MSEQQGRSHGGGAREATWSSPQATWAATGHRPPPPGPSSPVPPPAGRSRFPLSPALLVGLCALVAGAVIELSFHSYQSVNGVVTDCTYVNVAPLLFGPVGAVAGMIALVRSRRAGSRRGLELALGFLCVVLGIVHVLGGLDLLGGVTLTVAGNPC